VNVCGVVQGGDVGSTATAAGATAPSWPKRKVVFSRASHGVGLPLLAVIIRAVVNFSSHGAGVTRTYVQTWSVNQ
jgi:hypothetical protein